MENESLKVPVEKMSACLDYLATRPYKEVAHLISALIACERIQDPPAEVQQEKQG